MKTYTLSVSILILAVALFASVLIYNAQNAAGSVIMGGEYDVTELSSGTSTIYTLPGTIGSFVVASSSSKVIISVYATSSSATSSADLLFGFDASAANGTYQYDVAVPKGILIEVPVGFNGSIDMTHRR